MSNEKIWMIENPGAFYFASGLFLMAQTFFVGNMCKNVKFFVKIEIIVYKSSQKD